MNKLLVIRFYKLFTESTREEWNGRDSDDLYGTTTVKVKKWSGMRLTLSEIEFDTTEAEHRYAEAVAFVEENEAKFPGLVSVELTETSGIGLNVPIDGGRVIASVDIEEDFDDLDENTALVCFPRSGMSNRLEFARTESDGMASLTIPIKHNRRGYSARGYAAYLESTLDEEWLEDTQYWFELFTDHVEELKTYKWD